MKTESQILVVALLSAALTSGAELDVLATEPDHAARTGSAAARLRVKLQQPAPSVLRVEPMQLELEVGETAQINATVVDAEGNVVSAPVLFLSMSRRAVTVEQDGRVEARRPGEFTIIVRVPRAPDADPAAGDALLETTVHVTVAQPEIVELTFIDPPTRFYAGSTAHLEVRAIGADGAIRRDPEVRYSTDNSTVATIDRRGNVALLGEGTAELVARSGNARASLAIAVEHNPIAALTLDASMTEARTGDIIRFTATPRDSQGNPVPEAPVLYTFRAKTVAHDAGEPPSGMITEEGQFVADLPGDYTIVAVSGGASAVRTVHIEPRNARRGIELVGHGPVRDRFGSDLWVWEAADGRDYAVTGTWGAEGHAYFWDVTDPANMKIVDKVQVDARTVNDVKISDDGRIGVISREGASTRRNGLVILDVSNPAEGVRVLSRFDDQLTGGVHNVFMYDDHVYALSAGQRYDIINIEDPGNPHRVGSFELDTPGHAIHDVWVEDGVAYSSNWADGVVAVDVGGGGKGGSPRNPVILGSYAYPGDWNHAAVPYVSKSTGKRYVFAGDEAARGRPGRPEFSEGTPGYENEPERFKGWIHIIEWDDWANPKEVARYEVPEAGTHNIWVEDDILYVGYYAGGLRVVDVSGELMGDLYRQGREIAYFKTLDPEGFVPNAPLVWGAQPYKGNIFFVDGHSGLWAVRLVDAEIVEASRE